MSTDEHSGKWIDFESFGETRHILRLTPNEFFVLTYRGTSGGLMKFNKRKNQITEYACDHDMEQIKLMAFNKKENEIYTHSRNGLLDVFDNNIKAEMHSELSILPSKFIDHTTEYKCDYFLFIGEYFHILNGTEHWIVPQDPNELQLRITIAENVWFGPHGQAIYVASKHIILLFGADRERKGKLWTFCLKMNKWMFVDDVFNGYQFGAVLTSDERYVILLGGWQEKENEWYGNRISVIDLKNGYQIKESSIHLTETGLCYATRTGGIDSKDEILTFGYIRNCYKEEEFKTMQLPPICIFKMIAASYEQEMIHWVNSDGTHKGIYLKDVVT